MTTEEFIKYIEDRTAPYTFRETGRAKLSELFRNYPESLLLDCVDIGIQQYFTYDADGNLTKESVGLFLNKLGGIAFNKSRSPIDQEIKRIAKICKNNFYYWDDRKGEILLEKYVLALKQKGWSEEKILNDLKDELTIMSKSCRNWTEWTETVEHWINDIENWDTEEKTNSEQEEGFEDINSYLSAYPAAREAIRKARDSGVDNEFWERIIQEIEELESI